MSRFSTDSSIPQSEDPGPSYPATNITSQVYVDNPQSLHVVARPPQRRSLVQPGVHNCTSSKCELCEKHLKNIRIFTSTTKQKSHEIKDVFTCKSSSVIYVIECQKPDCKKQYVGKTRNSLKSRFSRHKSDVSRKCSLPVYEHFNSKGHSFQDLKIFPIEQHDDLEMLDKSEIFWIKTLGTQYPDGLNLEIYESEFSARPCKRRRELSSLPLEAQQKLDKCYESEKEARYIISSVHEKLQPLSCSGNDEEFLNQLRKMTFILSSKKIYDNLYVGIFGKTGAGKSSLINALLNEINLLPTSGQKACTSCIVEVKAHEDLFNETYKAEIEFISKEDWIKELKTPFESCQIDNDQGLSDPDDDDDEDGEDSEGEMAKEKLTAVYGEEGPSKSYDELVNIKLEMFTPPKKTIIAESVKELSKNINQFIRSDMDSKTKSYWPLVKSVTLCVPRNQNLLDNVVLIDFPGIGDTNKDRNEMWKKSLSKCTAVWIVSDITRAESDQNALKILKNVLKDIVGGGQCQNITFICTKTDIVGIQSGDMRDEQQGMSSENTENTWKQREILKRNNLVKERLKKKYETIAKKVLGPNVLFQEDFIEVFTVSSEQYRNEKNPVLNKDETEFPRLEKHLMDLYVTQIQKDVENYVTEVSGITSFLNVPQKNAKDEGKTNMKIFKEMSGNLTKELQRLEKVFDSCKTNLEIELNKGVKTATKECLENAENILKPKRKKDYRGYHKTVSALVRNDGTYKSKNGEVHDLNSKLASPLYKFVDESFNTTFRVYHGTRNTIKGALNVLLTNVPNTSDKITPLRLVFIKSQFKGVIASLEKEIIERKKNMYNSLDLSIQKELAPVYEDARNITGSKFMTKVLTMFTKRLEELKDLMFENAKNEMLHEFTKLKDYVICKLKSEMEQYLKLALSQFPESLDLPDFQEELKKMKIICNDLELTIFTQRSMPRI
ncbi:nuclear GTPase SLIP-GC-like isoform X4 [Erpetoichthys calabaricus]|uniref:nuclear GTPase SLIP-GC-like isoform X2 n=1 Tax=Erpetoichthys calabaricus TaxID=27687 RepID=UPI0022344867|nr:nuclear GTPase SLIP-GC-like isoform X2 [Erpetoichthys calabaricus]XP_051774703.1 nuclear GTPase SLIP-GC-like isoform X4 [Erpetoichthys calabaricus]